MKISLKTYSYTTPFLKHTIVNQLGFNKGLSTDVVSFSSVDVDKEDAYNLKNIPNLPCACCGKRMINEDLARKYTSKVFETPAISALKSLKPLSKDFRATEKTVYNLLKRSANKHPYEDLNTLLNRRYYYHLNRLESNQLKILSKAVNAGNNLSDESKIELNKVLLNARNILFQESKNERQKRSRIIKGFVELSKQIPEKDIVEKMIKILKTLPNSTNDVDSYVVKYSQRGNREIGQRLISPSLPSLDHIKVASKSGENEFYNLLVTCQKCNFERSNTPYSEWIKIHPEIPKHVQKNIDRIIKEINSGKLKNFDNYPKEIQKTLYKESKGKIKLDISSLETKRLSSN